MLCYYCHCDFAFALCITTRARARRIFHIPNCIFFVCGLWFAYFLFSRVHSQRKHTVHIRALHIPARTCHRGVQWAWACAECSHTASDRVRCTAACALGLCWPYPGISASATWLDPNSNPSSNGKGRRGPQLALMTFQVKTGYLSMNSHSDSSGAVWPCAYPEPGVILVHTYNTS